MRALSGRAECCWTATAPQTSYPRLDGDRRFDAVVVGGGIVGLTAALALAESGRSVALLEARRIGRQVTGRSSAKITTQHRLIYRQLIDTLGRDKARLYAEANRTGLDHIRSTIGRHRIDCDLETRAAYVWIGEDRADLPLLKAEAEAAQGFGLPADVVDRAPLPFPTGGALRFSGQAQFNPARYLIGLAEAVVRAGGTVFEQTRVQSVDEADRWRVKAEGGTVETPDVFVATNMPVASPLKEYSQRTQPRYHIVTAFRIAPGDAPDGMFISAGEPSHSIRTGRDGDGPLLITLGPRFDTGNEGNVPRLFHELEDWTRARFKVGDLVWRWGNEDYDTADRVPYVGAPSPDAPGFYIATGFNAWGITNGAAAGLLVADRILGRDNPFTDLYAPARPFPKGFHQSGDTQSWITDVDDLRPGGGGVIKADGSRIAVWKDDSGIAQAVSAVCTHKGCTVTWNAAERTWDCPCHGSIFAADGQVIHGPAVRPLAPCKVPSS